MMNYLTLAILVFLARFEEGLGARRGSLEINYEKLTDGFYHANNSNAIYGPASTKVTIGCMLPPSASAQVQDAERHNLLWKKGDTDVICAQLESRDSCAWLDPSATRSRGMKLLEFLLVDHHEDDFKRNFGSSGTYTCYHSRRDFGEANVQVYVAGSLLEILVNSNRPLDRSFQLPDKAVTDTERKTLVLECAVTAGAKNLLPDKKFVWYRNERPISPSAKFDFSDRSNRRLEIKKAGSGDGGVYMCEAEFESGGGTTLKSRDYVILKGDPTSSAQSVFFSHWHWHLVSAVLLLRLLFSSEL